MAELTLQNVGGWTEKKHFTFENGDINLLELPNAAGKTSITRALTAIISLPLSNDELRREAGRIGIKSFQGGQEPLVNINKDMAEIKLTFNGNERLCRISKNGEVEINGEWEGDERFILAGVLTRESKIYRQLTSGANDVKWLVDILSLAEEYEKTKTILEDVCDEYYLKLDTYEKLIKEKKQTKKKTKEARKNLKDVREKIGKITQEIPGVPEDLREEKQEAEEEVERLENGIGNIKEKIEEEKRKLREVSKKEREINKLERKKETIDEKMKKNTKEKKKIQKEIDEWPKRLEEVRERITPELEKIEKEIRRIREERGKKHALINMLQPSLGVMKTEEKQTAICPLCGEGQVKKIQIKEQVETLKEKVRKNNEELADLISEKDELKKEVSDLKRKLERKKEKVKAIEKQNQALEEEYLETDKEIQHLQSQTTGKSIEKIKGDIKRLEEKVLPEKQEKVEEAKKTRKKKRKDVREITSAKEEKRQELGRLEEREKTIEEKIDKLTKKEGKIEDQLLGFFDEIGAPYTTNFEGILSEWIDRVERVIRALENEIREQREGIRREFNKELGKLVKRLNFDFYAHIDEEYNIRVQRNDAVQPISSLSESEKGIISIVLETVLNETYLTAPFFVIDGLLLDFEEERKEPIFDYLAQMAKEKYIIITELPS